MINEKDVFDALKKVIEPDLGKNIVELGLVTLVSTSDKSLSLRVETKNAAMHARKRMKEDCEFAIERSGSYVFVSMAFYPGCKSNHDI